MVAARNLLVQALTFDIPGSLAFAPTAGPSLLGIRITSGVGIPRSTWRDPQNTFEWQWTTVPDLSRLCAAAIGRGRSGVFYTAVSRGWALADLTCSSRYNSVAPLDRPAHGHRTSTIGPCGWHISLKVTSRVSTRPACVCVLYCDRLRVRRGFDRYKALISCEKSPCPQDCASDPTR